MKSQLQFLYSAAYGGPADLLGADPWRVTHGQTRTSDGKKTITTLFDFERLDRVRAAKVAELCLPDGDHTP